MLFITLGTFEIDVYLHDHCSTEYQLFTRQYVFDVTQSYIFLKYNSLLHLIACEKCVRK